MGEFYALATALLFAIGVILFKKSVGFVSPFALNLFKNCVALPLLLLTAILLRPITTLAMPTRDFLLILASGVLGVGISDTLFFMALRRLGASRTALLDCCYSPFVIVFSFFMMNESIRVITALGGVMILASVVVSSQRSFGEPIPRSRFWTGCACGVFAMATVAFAVVMVTPVLRSYPLIWISTIRMAGGLAILLPVLPFHPDRKSVYQAFRPQSGWKWMIGGAFFGSYLSLVTWLAGFKFSQAGPVALLNQTSTVFIVVLAAIFLKEPMTRLKLLAVAMAFAGAALIL